MFLEAIGVLVRRAEAGSSPRRASNFLSRRRKKVTKERATPLSASPALRYGATCGARGRGALRNSLRAGALRSNSRSESVHEARVSCGTRATPPAALLGAYRGDGGVKQPNSTSGHCFARPFVVGASASNKAQRVPGRAQRRPVWLFGCSRLSTPCGCACGGAVVGWHGRRSAHAS